MSGDGIEKPTLIILALIATLSGCSSGESSSATSAGLSVYLDFESPAQQVEWSRNRHFAVEESLAACVADEGFDYTPAPFVEASVYIRPTTRTEVERQGYGRFYRRGGTAVEVTEEPDEAESEISAAELAAKNEVFERCRAESWQLINKAWSEPRSSIQEALDDLNARIAADERTIALDRRWSACMAEGDWVVARPQEVLDLSERLIPEALTEDDMVEGLAKEVEIAVTDFDCKEPLVDEYLEVRTDHEREFIAKNQAVLFAIREEINRVELTVD